MTNLHLPGPHLCPVCNVVHDLSKERQASRPSASDLRPYFGTFLPVRVYRSTFDQTGVNQNAQVAAAIAAPSSDPLGYGGGGGLTTLTMKLFGWHIIWAHIPCDSESGFGHWETHLFINGVDTDVHQFTIERTGNTLWWCFEGTLNPNDTIQFQIKNATGGNHQTGPSSGSDNAIRVACWPGTVA